MSDHIPNQNNVLSNHMGQASNNVAHVPAASSNPLGPGNAGGTQATVARAPGGELPRMVLGPNARTRTLFDFCEYYYAPGLVETDMVGLPAISARADRNSYMPNHFVDDPTCQSEVILTVPLADRRAPSGVVGAHVVLLNRRAPESIVKRSVQRFTIVTRGGRVDVVRIILVADLGEYAGQSSHEADANQGFADTLAMSTYTSGILRPLEHYL